MSFNKLPPEVRLHIFDTALALDCQPRNIEITVKNGQIYSKAPPPPLLHVCQASRYIILRKNKPWLSMFEGTPAHEPWKDIVKRNGPDELSRLQNVCIDLQRDTLVIRNDLQGLWDFGNLERQNLRSLAVDLEAIQWTSLTQLAQHFHGLRNLVLFDPLNTTAKPRQRNRPLALALGAFLENRMRSEPGYTAPQTLFEVFPEQQEWEGDLSGWVTYKHWKGQAAHPSTSDRAEGSHIASGASARSSQDQDVRKRKRDDYEDFRPLETSRKAIKMVHRTAAVTVDDEPHTEDSRAVDTRSSATTPQHIASNFEPPDGPNILVGSTPTGRLASVRGAENTVRQSIEKIGPAMRPQQSSVGPEPARRVVDLRTVSPVSLPAPIEPPEREFYNPLADWDDSVMGGTLAEFHAETQAIASQGSIQLKFYRPRSKRKKHRVSIDSTEDEPVNVSSNTIIDLTADSSTDEDEVVQARHDRRHTTNQATTTEEDQLGGEHGVQDDAHHDFHDEPQQDDQHEDRQEDVEGHQVKKQLRNTRLKISRSLEDEHVHCAEEDHTLGMKQIQVGAEQEVARGRSAKRQADSSRPEDSYLTPNPTEHDMPAHTLESDLPVPNSHVGQQKLPPSTPTGASQVSKPAAREETFTPPPSRARLQVHLAPLATQDNVRIPPKRRVPAVRAPRAVKVLPSIEMMHNHGQASRSARFKQPAHASSFARAFPEEEEEPESPDHNVPDDDDLPFSRRALRHSPIVPEPGLGQQPEQDPTPDAQTPPPSDQQENPAVIDAKSQKKNITEIRRIYPNMSIAVALQALVDNNGNLQAALRSFLDGQPPTFSGNSNDEVALPPVDEPNEPQAEVEDSAPAAPIEAPVEDEEEYTPEKIIAERTTATGLQYLIKWEHYPNEKNWTWESEADLLAQAPDIVVAWKMKGEHDADKNPDELDHSVVEHIPEKIWGKRKRKGKVYYWVEWKGFKEKKDWTWEPGERLGVDVPIMVQLFEAKIGKGKGKGRRKTVG